jgi:hypothetical protein
VDAVDAITTESLTRLLEQQMALRAVAEEQARAARAALLRVAETLCGHALEEVCLDAPGRQDLDAEMLADLVIVEVQGRLDQADLDSGDEALRLYQQARAEIERLQEELDQAQRQAEQDRAARELAEAAQARKGEQVRTLEQTAADLQRRLLAGSQGVVAQQRQLPNLGASPPAPVHPRPGPEPGWMKEWRVERVFERTSALVTVIGETGECRRYLLAQMMGERLGLDAKHGGIKRTFGYTVKRGLTEQVQFQQVISGGSTHLLRLTPKGQQAYLFLAGAEAAPSLLDDMLRRHRSAEHAFLNLEAADLLEQAGYAVDRFPVEMELSGKRKFLPDLGAISPDGEVLWVEVERDTGKSARDRDKKWSNYYEASGGHLVIVTADRQAMHKIRSEIMFWAGKRPLRLWMTNITEVRADERGRDGSIWLQRRGER